MIIENYIENAYRELIDIKNIEYNNLYEPFENEKLIKIFSTLHYIIIENFNLMNELLPTHRGTKHFWADPSRELMKAISFVRRLEKELKNTKYSFKIDEYYDEIIKETNSFLSANGGSSIPEGMHEIEIYYMIPIFNSVKTINVKSVEGQRSYYKKLIGEGSYAHIYKYHDSYYNRNFVIKSAKTELNKSEIERFKIEYDTLSMFNSPYITEVYRYIEESNEYIMEHMDMDLYSYINKNNNTISNDLRIGISRQILRGMDYIHSKNLLHRDINPKNILMRIYDDVPVVKISDFGLIKNPDNEMTNLETKIKGYFNDFAELQRVGFSNYAMEHETYALTRIIAFVLTGKTNLSKITDDRIRKFVDKGTSSEIGDRFKSVKEMTIFLDDL